ncbi:MAG TPA: right-handed parallel beta-helix repeat-containing protein [Gemmatimonadales bacterium]|nr:right-handed parallel beta-helix repeat-containing protein [Gemmatimonadales bacterium]
MNVRHSLACAIAALSLVALHARADSDGDRERDRDRDRTTTVDCAAGDTVARALRHGDERKSLTILVNGSCSEHVVINRSDIKLAAAAAGATISGPDPTIDVIRVTGTRVTIDGITITGGRNGVTADGAAGLIVQNALVQGTGRNGITYAHGASGVVDSTVVTGNARDGVAVDAASGTVINSQVNQNARMGVGVFNGGTARIGIDNRNDAGGNTISANGVNGIHIVYGSTGLIAANQIRGNGTNPSVAFSGNGVNIANATANLIGGNTISGNAGPGINLRSGSVNLGDANFDMPTVNTITGNGNPNSTGGISGFLGSALSIRDAVISNNVGFGVVLAVRSTAQIGNSTIQNNRAIPGPVPGTVIAGDGIQLQRGSAVLGITPNSSVTQNEGFGVNCTDLESSVANTLALGIGTNTRGGVACTGF